MLVAVLATTLRNCAGFDRRVTRLLRSPTFQVLIVAKSEPHVACECRGKVCAEVCRHVDDCADYIIKEIRTFSVDSRSDQH